MRRLFDLSRSMTAPTFLDVGSNFGVYSFFFAVDPRFREIVCFEPHPACFAQLKLHHELNGSDPRFQFVQAAASDTVRTTPFFQVHTGNVGASAVDPEPGRFDKREGEMIEVKSIVLDEFLDRQGEELVIKMDVEGHEEEALAGLSKTLQNNRVVIQVEAFSDQKTLIDQMKKNGAEFQGSIGTDCYFVSG